VTKIVRVPQISIRNYVFSLLITIFVTAFLIYHCQFYSAAYKNTFYFTSSGFAETERRRMGKIIAE